MFKISKYFVIGFLLSLVLISCGPSPEAAATMTAAAWTPTPEPTLTPLPTPIPFDLNAKLVGTDGETIFFDAYVSATEHEEVMVDESGMAVLSSLPGPEVEVSITAQGYEPHTETVTLANGPNEVTFTLTADPAQINPATACDEGQKVFFIEDFEDDFTQGWGESLNRADWVFEEIEDRGKAITYNGGSGGGFATQVSNKEDYGNLVWKFDVAGGNTHFALHGNNNDILYRVIFQTPGEGVIIMHEEELQPLYAAQKGYQGTDWIRAAITYFDGTVEFWIDDELYVSLKDPDPIESGGLGFITHAQGAPLAMDNMVICELTEPYAPAGLEVVEE